MEVRAAPTRFRTEAVTAHPFAVWLERRAVRGDLEPIAHHFQQSTPVDNRHDQYPRSFDSIDQPITVDEALVNRRIFDLGDHTTDLRELGQHLGDVNDFANDRASVLGRVSLDVRANRLDVLNRFWRPDYFVSHRSRRCSTCACDRLPSWAAR